ncbi:MAG: PD-(D/E)XK nuclease family protein [Patescibacteria group bacterium]|nr:PD-(D/E)XK nuclease family protein [Patescibacteria group bacterium]
MSKLGLDKAQYQNLHIGLNPDGRFLVDNSALASWYGCTTAGVLRYLHGLTNAEESANLKAGSACHSAREYYLKTDNLEGALECLDSEYKEWAGQHVVADDRLAWSNVRTIVGEYLKSLEPLGEGKYRGSVLAYPDPEQVEIAFCLPLDEAAQIYFCGRLDGLGDYGRDGLHYAIEEFKTTGMANAAWAKKWKLGSQITGYLWAARQLADKPVVGAFVQGLELSALPSDPTRKCSKHGQKYSECRLLHAKWETVGLLERPQGMIDGWFADALEAATKMRKLAETTTLDDVQNMAQEGMFNGTCSQFNSTCQFAGACEMGRAAHLIQANYKVERWSPFKD